METQSIFVISLLYVGHILDSTIRFFKNLFKKKD